MPSHAKELGFPTFQVQFHWQKKSVGEIIWLTIWLAGWWFGTFELFFPSDWECHHPNCYSVHHFSEGLAATTNQLGSHPTYQPKKKSFVPMNSIEIPRVFHSFPRGPPGKTRSFRTASANSAPAPITRTFSEQKSSIQSLKIEGKLTPFDPYTVTMYIK